MGWLFKYIFSFHFDQINMLWRRTFWVFSIVYLLVAFLMYSIRLKKSIIEYSNNKTRPIIDTIFALKLGIVLMILSIVPIIHFFVNYMDGFK